MMTYRTLMSPSRFMLQEDIEDDLCSDDPWLVLHKIDSPTKMRFVGNKVAQCDPSTLNSSKLAPSIARYVGAEGDSPTLCSSVCMIDMLGATVVWLRMTCESTSSTSNRSYRLMTALQCVPHWLEVDEDISSSFEPNSGSHMADKLLSCSCSHLMLCLDMPPL